MANESELVDWKERVTTRYWEGTGVKEERERERARARVRQREKERRIYREGGKIARERGKERKKERENERMREEREVESSGQRNGNAEPRNFEADEERSSRGHEARERRRSGAKIG